MTAPRTKKQPARPKLAFEYGYIECGETLNGWHCSLRRRHRGPHQAWCTEPDELMALWDKVRPV